MAGAQAAAHVQQLHAAFRHSAGVFAGLTPNEEPFAGLKQHFQQLADAPIPEDAAQLPPLLPVLEAGEELVRCLFSRQEHGPATLAASELAAVIAAAADHGDPEVVLLQIGAAPQMLGAVVELNPAPVLEDDRFRDAVFNVARAMGLALAALQRKADERRGTGNNNDDDGNHNGEADDSSSSDGQDEGGGELGQMKAHVVQQVYPFYACVFSRSSALRARWHADAELVRVAASVRWDAVYMSKSCLMLPDDAEPVTFLMPEQRFGFSARLRNCSGITEVAAVFRDHLRDQLLAFAADAAAAASGAAPGGAPAAVPAVAAVVPEFSTASPMSLYQWQSVATTEPKVNEGAEAMVPYAAMPWDIDVVPADLAAPLRGGRRVAILTFQSRIFRSVRRGDDFPWVHGSMEVTELLSAEQVVDALGQLAAVRPARVLQSMRDWSAHTFTGLFDPERFCAKRTLSQLVFAAKEEEDKAAAAACAAAAGGGDGGGGGGGEKADGGGGAADGQNVNVEWDGGDVTPQVVWAVRGNVFRAAEHIKSPGKGCTLCSKALGDGTSGGDDALEIPDAASEPMDAFRSGIYAALLDGVDPAAALARATAASGVTANFPAVGGSGQGVVSCLACGRTVAVSPE